MKLQQWTCSDAQGTFRRWPSVPIHKTPGSLRESGLTGPRETDPSPSTAQVWRIGVRSRLRLCRPLYGATG